MALELGAVTPRLDAKNDGVAGSDARGFCSPQISASESIYLINNHKGLAIGNGLMFYLMQVIPVLGWILAPAYAVVAATLSLHEVKELIPARAK